MCKGVPELLWRIPPKVLLFLPEIATLPRLGQQQGAAAPFQTSPITRAFFALIDSIGADILRCWSFANAYLWAAVSYCLAVLLVKASVLTV